MPRNPAFWVRGVRPGGTWVGGVMVADFTSDTPRSSIRYIERVISPDAGSGFDARGYRPIATALWWYARANILRRRRAAARGQGGKPAAVDCRSDDRSVARCRITYKEGLPAAAPAGWHPPIRFLV